jgi:hypothetical protein
MTDPRDNVVPFRSSPPRKPADRQLISVDMDRYPVDIRGNVTFGRLLSGLATVGLTVRIDSRSGRVVITDDAWEER